MGIGHTLLRIVVFLITIPLAYLAAFIPGYAGGCIVGAIGLPVAIGQYLVGGIVFVYFIAKFQWWISPPKTTA